MKFHIIVEVDEIKLRKNYPKEEKDKLEWVILLASKKLLKDGIKPTLVGRDKFWESKL